MMLLLIVLSLPVWSYAKRFGFRVSGSLSFCLLVFIGLLLFHVF